MSNTVDILLVGGPKNGLIVCQPLPVPTTILLASDTYTTMIHASVYRVAVYSDDDVEDVAGEIVSQGFKPSWDLLE